MSEVKPFYAAPVTNDMSHDHNYSLCVLASDFDAQRLRADTAETKAADYLLAWGKCAELRDAAEQRIADTVAKLQLAADMLDDDERGNRFAQVLQLAMAALNPNPEAESHEG